MARNLFISFLGTNNYLPCNYELPGMGRIENVRFVQEALVQILCRNFDGSDRIVLFLTKEAREKNWNDSDKDGETIQGLKSRLKACGVIHMVEEVEIREGKSPEELWQIFGTVLGKIEEKDRVFFDITHGFRSLPMLGLALLNYARFLKNIIIEGIYYGAFEARDKDNNAPVFDLTSFATLLEWAGAVHDFVNHGNTASIADLLRREALPRIAETRGGDQTTRLWRDVGGCLDQICGQIMTNRGAEILAGNSFVNLQKRLAEAATARELPEPFRPMMQQLENKVSGFSANNPYNCLEVCRWCLEHGLVQQGLTMLQEAAVTILCERFGLNWKKIPDRELVSDSIHVINRKIDESEWKKELKERREETLKITTDPQVRDLAKPFDRLSQARNDINHGGFLTDARRVDKLGDTLELCLCEMEQILRGER